LDTLVRVELVSMQNLILGRVVTVQCDVTCNKCVYEEIWLPQSVRCSRSRKIVEGRRKVPHGWNSLSSLQVEGESTCGYREGWGREG